MTRSLLRRAAIVGASVAALLAPAAACTLVLGIEDLHERPGYVTFAADAGEVLFSSACGQSAAAKDVALRNDSTSPASWTAELAKGKDSPFVISKSQGMLEPGDTEVITVGPAPSAAGAGSLPDAYTDTLVVHAPPKADIKLSLRLVLQGAVLVATPDGLDAGDQPYNGTSPGFPITIKNAGNQPATFTLAAAPPWHTTAVGEKELEPDASLVTFVSFSPTAAGSLDGKLSIAASGDTVLCGSSIDGVPLHGNGILGVVEIASGTRHTCARRSDGTVACWGNDDRGQLGNGLSKPNDLTFNFGVPQEVGMLPAPATGLGLGWRFSCAALSPYAVACWGDNNLGQSGNPTYGPTQVEPFQLLLDPETDAGFNRIAAQISAHSFTACLRDQGGAVYCWGDANINSTILPGYFGYFGQDPSIPLDDAGSTSTAYPRAVPLVGPTNGFADIAASTTQICGRLGAKTLCWPNPTLDDAGVPGEPIDYGPQPMLGPDGGALAGKLGSGGGVICVIVADGHIYCRGDNSSGQLGDGTGQSSFDRAVQVKDIDDAVAVKGGHLHTCAIRRDGSVWCWGDNASGQLGNGTSEPSLVPTKVIGLPEPAIAISASDTQISSFTCALTVAGHVWCWGANNMSQLGQGDAGLISSPTPLRVNGL